MRLSVVLGFAACFLLPFQSQAAWDIFQSYVILDSGSGDQFLAGGLNADGATAFAGTDLGDFTAADALTLNGGELKTYKNSGSNVCGGTLNYRVYASGDTPGAFTALALPYDSELANPGDQKWAATGAGIDLLGALTAGDYVLELYWEATGDDAGGCSDTKYDSDFGNNFTATFSIVVPGCTDPAYAEYDAAATTDDGSCATLIDPCENALVLGSIEVDLSTTTLTAEDGSATLTVTAGTPTSLTLTGINGAADYTFAQPGAIDGIAAGSYSVMATDANGCTSNTLMLTMTYSLCCDGCANDQDIDGICDDEDNCFDRNATNFADPANEACDFPCTNGVVMDGYYYNIVEIGDQCWFAENLRTTVFRNGDVIPSVLGNSWWMNTPSPATVVYGQGSASCYSDSPSHDACDHTLSLEAYGRLYNHHAVMSWKGLCPTGWHVPSDEDWFTLEAHLGMDESTGLYSANWRGTDEGHKLKSTSGWADQNNGDPGGGSNATGFNARPGGERATYDGAFRTAGEYTHFWTSESSVYNQWFDYYTAQTRRLSSFRDEIYRGRLPENRGLSVRCIRDAD